MFFVGFNRVSDSVLQEYNKKGLSEPPSELLSFDKTVKCLLTDDYKITYPNFYHIKSEHLDARNKFFGVKTTGFRPVPRSCEPWCGACQGRLC